MWLTAWGLSNNGFIMMPISGVLRKPLDTEAQGACGLVTRGCAGRWGAPAQWGQRLLPPRPHLPRGLIGFASLCPLSQTVIRSVVLSESCGSFLHLWKLWGSWAARTGS